MLKTVTDVRSLGATIKALRHERGWSQEYLAELIGGKINQGGVSKLERGDVELPRRPRLERIAEVFGLSLGELLARSGWSDADEYFAALAAQDGNNSKPERDPRVVRASLLRDIKSLPDAAILHLGTVMEGVKRMDW